VALSRNHFCSGKQQCILRFFFQFFLINGTIFEETFEDKMGVLIFSTNFVLFYE
jgi:hypothetical protein